MRTDIVYPPKLRHGSHLRVIAPSRSGAILSGETIARATARLTEVGFTVSFGAHWQENDSDYLAASIDARLEDLHSAFADPTVDGILTAIGGHNANQLLQHIDYNLIRKNPKIFCGFSDITTLCNAIFAKTGMATYYGPHFSSWGMQQGLDYTVQAVQDGLLSDKSYDVTPSDTWSDDPWFIDQVHRTFESNTDGNIVLRPGTGEGVLVGGHLSTFLRLSGTPYWPGLTDSIVCIEQSAPFNFRLFDAELQALIQHAEFSKVRGLLIGRFQKDCHVSASQLQLAISSKPELHHIPVLANVNIGHTTPITVLPIGGKCRIDTTTQYSPIVITNH
jgi:muramoyltetrapeptide carboxypeptidase